MSLSLYAISRLAREKNIKNFNKAMIAQYMYSLCISYEANTFILLHIPANSHIYLTIFCNIYFVRKLFHYTYIYTRLI